MIWIKLTHSGGEDYINLGQVYRIYQTSGTQLTFYDANSILPISYNFATNADLKDALSKFQSIVRVIDIDNLAPQG
jgi:hypothetical protein